MTISTYTATISGHSLQPRSVEVSTITEGRKYAEGYGNTADRCAITDRRGRVVAMHMRDTSGDGLDWFKASV